MVFDLPFRDAEHFGQLVGGQPGACQKSDEALARRLIGERHRAIMVRQSHRPMQNLFRGFHEGIDWQRAALPAS